MFSYYVVVGVSFFPSIPVGLSSRAAVVLQLEPLNPTDGCDSPNKRLSAIQDLVL